MDLREAVRRHHARTYRAALRIVGQRDEALDVVQDCFLALHAEGEAVPADRVGPWLVRVAVHRAIDLVRRRAHPAGRPVPLGGLEPPGSAPGPGEPAERADERERLARALGRLPERQREVVALRVVEELTFVELSALLGISEGAAKVHFRRGLAALRTHLEGAGPP